MASPVGFRPIWHTLRRSRITIPKLQTSRCFASEVEAPEQSTVPSREELLRAREVIQRKKAEYIEYTKKTGLVMQDTHDLFEAQAELEMLLQQKDGAQENTRKKREPTYGNTAVQYPDAKDMFNVEEAKGLPEGSEGEGEQVGLRMPRAVQALYLRPLRREAKYGIPCCDLQLRSYSVRNLEFFADWALRAAYYLHLPAFGPVPLPKITQRWTVPRSSFIFKKSQENFERVTVRRLIQIKDGHPETVELWLAFLRKHQYHGVGMKANVWEYDKIGTGKEMDLSLDKAAEDMKKPWENFGRRKNPQTAAKIMEIMNSEKYRRTVAPEATE